MRLHELLSIVVLLTLTAAAPALGGMTGTVVDSDGRPIEGATACHVVDRVEILCVMSEADGSFEIPASHEHDLRVRAPDFVSVTRPASGKNVLIEMKRSPSLLVRLVDADSGNPIDKGELYVVYPSAERKGPFPTNRAGVRVRRVLSPGEVRLLARAEGFEDSEPHEITLEPGKEAEAVIELRPSKAARKG